MKTEQQPPTIDDCIELPRLAEAQISPDGSLAAYQVNTPDWKKNEYVDQIWLSGRQLTYARESSTHPRWSPDGHWIAFLSKRAGDEHVQIYRISTTGGEAERLTELPSDVQNLAWSPDGASIAFILTEPESEAEKQRKERFGEVRIEDQDYQRAHLWVLELANRACRKLTHGDEFHVADLDWRPDARRIAFEAWPSPDEADSDRARIFVVDVNTLEVIAVTEEGAAQPRWSPDGNQIAYARYGTPTYYKNIEVWVLPFEGGGPAWSVSAGFDEAISLCDWGPDGIYFMAIQRTSAHLFRIDPHTGVTVRLTPARSEGWAMQMCSFDANFDRSAMIVGDAAHLPEVIVLSLRDGTFEQITENTARIASWKIGRPEVMRWLSEDATPIEGILFKPPDFDPSQKHPLLVVIHGGPTDASLLALMPGIISRYYPAQLWLAKGGLVLMPNYRGSAGYGEEFRSLNVGNLGLGDYWDVISGVDALIEKGWVDPERVGAMGWSQGGYISAFIATYSDRFKAVSVGAGISNWVTYYVNTDIHPFTRQYLRATPWEDMEIYSRTSPMTYIRQAKTPTLIQHGELDRRVPIPNAYELYQGLRDMGVETRLVVYQGMPHGISRPRLNREVMQENLDWFNRWIWGEQPAEASARACYISLCSKQKQEDAGDLPALQRYTAHRVQDVFHWSRRDAADFRIFSGKFGLLSAKDPVPYYDHLLRPGEVSRMAQKVARQLKEQGLRRLIVYTAPLNDHPAERVYLGCLQVAAGAAGDVTLEHREVSEPDW